MSDWITDRRPTAEDCGGGLYVVYDSHGMLVHFVEIDEGEPWKPDPKSEPYVKPKRWTVSKFGDEFTAYDSVQREHVTPFLPTREAAERIAAIYEEVMP